MDGVYGQGAREKLRELIVEIFDKSFVLLGGFNQRGIDWTLNCCDNNATVEACLFLDYVNDCFVTQHMDFLTTEKSLLHLILTKEPDLIYDVQDVGSFGTSDHKLICCNLDTDTT